MEINKTFGEALEALKKGSNISRSGWNGKNMFLYINKGSFDFNTLIEEQRKEDAKFYIEGIDRFLFDKGDSGTITRCPNINMKTATNSTVTGWLASQTDMLANDWCILD